MTKELGLYIHVPFCMKKCNYCDFNSFAAADKLIPEYFKAVEKEIQLYSDCIKDYSIKSVFIGGGTPSYVDSKYVRSLLDKSRQYFRIKPDIEITIETNPGTLTYDKLEAYRSAGMNRLSIGLQAWQNDLLKYLGRIHSSEDFSKNFLLARKSGFENINVDLIFGIPGQTLEDWKETLASVIEYNPSHLSCYSLKIEEGTPFGKELEAGTLVPVEDELDREMYWTAIDFLSNNGYKHYEISNFARTGYECIHNLVYWNAEEYIGIGAGAHSYFNGSRYNNEYGIKQYITRLNENVIPIVEKDDIGFDEAMSEYMILGLRLVDGINELDFKSRFKKELNEVYGKEIYKLKGKGFIEQENGMVKLTKLGLDLANQVFIEFI
ncbi:MAG: radical SAM family heme chaperone HemW [Bacillota bacterium]|nr:radical SAM family heme chaperone HemW [Bacillota bacterium]